MSLLLDIFTVGTFCLHVVLSPYTKVEESFNLHATHDVLMYGVSPSSLPKYDHFIFPGAVPRSFFGGVLLGWLTNVAAHFAAHWGFIKTKRDILIMARLILATANGVGLILLRQTVSKRFGFASGLLFTLQTCTQFHLPFWIGRPLPNMFAILPVNLAFYYILDRMPNATKPSRDNVLKASSLLIFTSVVLRAEVALLLAPLILQAFILKWVTLGEILRICILSGLSSIGFTLLLDSYFWQAWPLWPELYSMYFNVYQGKSSDWGASAFHAYVTSHLPKLLLSGLPLSVLGFVVDSRIRSILIVPLTLIAVMSCLAHKEWRFIIYTVPLFNVAAARGATWLIRQRTRSLLGRLGIIVVMGLFVGNMLVTYVMTNVSSANYPGGEALMRVNERLMNMTDVHVHIDNYAAQTGASLFLQEHAPPYPQYITVPAFTNWIYNKTENLSPLDITRARHFTHVISENPEAFPRAEWSTLEAVKAFDSIKRNWQLNTKDITRSPFELVYFEKLWLLERKK